MENEAARSCLVMMGKEQGKSRLDAKAKENVGKWWFIRWFEEVIGNMGESREEEEVTHIRMLMTWQKVIGKKIRAREINHKILDFTISSGIQLLLNGLQLIINKRVIIMDDYLRNNN